MTKNASLPSQSAVTAGIRRRLLALGVGCLLGARLAGLEAAEPSPAADTGLREVRPGVLAIGEVTVDSMRREVWFPIEVNQRSNLVEYCVVSDYGKTHESVFRTGIKAHQLHAAMLLLGVHPPGTNAFSEDPAVLPPGPRILLDVRWRERGRLRTRPLEDMVTFLTNHSRTLPRGPWVYNGSHMHQGEFVAEAEGSIVSIQVDPAALINNPRPTRFFDDIHTVNIRKLPPAAARVELLIRVPPLPKGGRSRPATTKSPSP